MIRMFPRKSSVRLFKSLRSVVALAVLAVVFFSALSASWLAPYPLGHAELSSSLAAPSAKHWLGCDSYGADILTSLLYGARTSLFIGLSTVTLSVSVGVLVGLVSGYFGGWIDLVAMRVVDLLMAFPGLLVAMVLATVLGASQWSVVFAISATGWISTTRIVRAQVLSLREQPYVLASKTLGAGWPRIMRKHLLPGTLSPLLVHATFSLSGVIIVEAGLSFLGLGATDGAPSWGSLLAQGQSVLEEAPHLSLIPGLAIMLLVLSLNFLGDSLRDVWDPRMNN